MLTRIFSYAACVCLVASVTATGQSNQGVSYVFQLPGANASSGLLEGYIYDSSNLSPTFNVQNGPVGTYQIVARPDGSKFYILASNGTTTLVAADPALTTFTPVTGLAQAPTSIATSPDNQYLFVGAGGLYILDAGTLQVIQGPVTLPGNTVQSIVPSRDATKVYVLNSSPTASYVTEISIPIGTRVGQSLLLTGGASALTMSPLGLLYWTGDNVIYEIDPSTLTVTNTANNTSSTPTGQIPLFFSPGPLRFTPDGTTAYAVNRTPGSGGSILELNIATKATSTWPPFNQFASPPAFDDVLVASNSRILAISSATQTLWDVTPSPLSAASSSLTTAIPGTGINTAIISNELPTATYLYALVANGGAANLYRVSLATNSVSATIPAVTPSGFLQFLPIPPESGAAAFLQYNNNQSLNAGATSIPFLARVLDSAGRPVYNATVNFSTTSGATINTPTVITGADGYAQTTLVAPATGGSYTLVATSGNASAPFAFTVIGPNGSGTGTGTTPNVSQMNITGGDGQLALSFNQLPEPLAVQVIDANGNPIPNVAVTYALTSNSNGGLVESPNVTTDSNGNASTIFELGSVSTSLSFQASTITATSQYGVVTFYETALPINNFINPGFNVLGPSVEVLAPANGSVTIGAGTTVPGAIETVAVSQTNPGGQPLPIPYLNLEIIVPGTSGIGVAPVSSPVASCSGSALSDQNGNSVCNLKAGCTLGAAEIGILTGAAVEHDIQITVVPGGAGLITPSSGNNVTGKPGQVIPLSAVISDNCKNIVTGTAVNWSITQGSGTLSATTTTSNSGGVVATNLTLGQAAGTIQITASIPGVANTVFTVTNLVSVATLTVTGGGGQTAMENQNFAQPVAVTALDTNGKPVSNIAVTFSVASGSAAVNPPSATTNAQGQAQTNVTAGTSPGTVIIKATYSTFTANATLTVSPPGPVLTPASFVNAASFVEGLVPCSLATVIGNGIAPGVTGTLSGNNGFGPLSTTLGGLSLAVGGVTAPILSVSNTGSQQQATFQVPCEVPAGGTTTVAVSVSGSTTTVPNVPVFLAQPGIFTYAGPNGTTFPAVYSLATGSLVSLTNPAIPGQNYYMFVTGLGPVSPAASTNSLGTPNQAVTLPIIVGLNNAGVQVVSAQYLQQSIGVYIVEFTVPANEPFGVNVPLAIAAQVNNNYTFGGQGLVVLPAVQ